MVDFVGLLKRTIDAQSSATPALRRRVYDRTRETVEKQMAGKNIAENIRNAQRRALESAIAEVEADYSRAGGGGEADVFTALRENAGMKAEARPQPAAGRGQPPQQPFPAAAAPFSFGAADNDMPAAQAGFSQPGGNAAQDAAGNAYFGRSYAAAPAMSEAAYGGGFSESAPGSYAAPQNNGAPGRGFFRLDDEEDEPEPEAAGGDFAPYGGEEDAFARRSADAPVPPLPDFGEEFPPRPDGNADGRNESGEAAPYAAGLSGFSAYGEAAESEREETLAPPSPYNIERETVSENFAPEPPRPYAPPAEAEAESPAPNSGYGRDFPSLHNFLFGDEAAGRGDDPAAAALYQRHSYADETAGLPQPPAAAYDNFSEDEFEPEAPAERAAARPEQFSPVPDFLTEEPGSGNPAAAAPVSEGEAFNLGEALGLPAGPERGGDKKAAPAPLPAELLGTDDAAGPDMPLPEMPPQREAGKKQPQPGWDSAAAGGEISPMSLSAGSSVASGIFAQAAIQEKRRSSKKRLISGGAIILALLALLIGIIWFLTDFLKTDSHPIAALVSKGEVTDAPKNEPVEKANQRLTPDGHEVNAAPQPQPQTQAPAQPQADKGNSGNNAGSDSGQSAAAAPASSSPAADSQAAIAAANGEAVFREAAAALMPATSANGTVAWSLLHEKSPEGINDTVLRGELTIPDRDIVMRMTVRPNHDAGIPAVYLVELMFVVPENFEGTAIDNISPLMFKATRQSTGQELQDTRVYKIGDNVFIITLNTPQNSRNPQLQRNIALIEQLPWLSMNVAYKNGRIGEFTFGKGDNGEALFKQFFDAQSADNRGLAPSPLAAKTADKDSGQSAAPAPAAKPAK